MQFLIFMKNLKDHKWLILRVEMYNVILLKFHIILFPLFPVNLRVQLPTVFPVGLLVIY